MFYSNIQSVLSINSNSSSFLADEETFENYGQKRRAFEPNFVIPNLIWPPLQKNDTAKSLFDIDEYVYVLQQIYSVFHEN